MNRVGLIIVGLMVAAGCTQAPQLAVWRWSKASHGRELHEAPQAVQQLLVRARAGGHVISFDGQRVNRVVQTVNGAPIEGAGLQVLVGRDGQIEYASASALNEIRSEWSETIQNLRSQKAALLQKWHGRTGRRWANHPIEAEVVVVRHDFAYLPVLKVEVLEESEARLREYWLNENGQIVHERLLTMAGAVDGVATVFPGLPNRSTLVEQILPSLLGDGTLTGPMIRALSADGDTPIRPSNDFRFTPAERAFDDVQAYFFADQQSRWFAQVLGLKLNLRLELKLHVGAPVPGNAMFYYRGQIRLGDGDGRLYRGIPRDPSIVKHEVSHAFVEAISGLPFDGEGGAYSEAFSDLFTALADMRPQMGPYAYVPGPYKRTLENQLRADRDMGGGKYENSLVISGTFWEVRENIGAEATARLARGFLARLGPSGRFSDFVESFGDAARAELNPDQQKAAMVVMAKRGWLARSQ